MQSWQTTRNTYEAAALAALDIALRPVTMRDHKTGREFTDWNLARASSVDPERNGRAFITGVLRQSGAGTDLLHPYLIAMRAMHNRARLLDAHKTGGMRLAEVAPGSFLIEPGPAPSREGQITFTSADQDLVIALIGCGHALLDVAHNGQSHSYTLARYALPPTTAPTMPRADCEPLITALRSNALFPARRWEHFPLQIHALHCLRELRRHQHSGTWITVRHKTFREKGAAFRADASDHTLSHVQTRLGIRL